MATVLSDVEWEACALEPRRDRELESVVRRGFGSLPSSVVYFTPVPWVVRSMLDMSAAAAPPLHLDSILTDLVGLVVSQDNSCRYCFSVQRLLMRVHGVPEARIRQVEQNFLDAEIDPSQKAAIDFARRISRAAPLASAADAATLREAGWSRDAMVELAFQAAYNVYMNRLMTVGAVPPAPIERAAASRAVSWLAPIIRFQMRRRQKRARARARLLEPTEGVGPWSDVVRALAGSTCARPLRETLDAAFASSVLPRRAKALVFAVVARALDCDLGERESRALLVDGGLREAQIDSALTHLGSPDLEPLENELLPFARGTVRGRPLQLQQRTRALAERLGPEQTVEAIAVASLANAVCRLGVVTQLG